MLSLSGQHKTDDERDAVWNDDFHHRALESGCFVLFIQNHSIG
jgi:hypothetical protein